MRAHAFLHVSHEGLGSIEEWLGDNGYHITRTKFFEGEDLPPLDEIDVLVVMGGPMSVNDETEHPWLTVEKRFIREAFESGKPVLGICLGSQLIASALGAEVKKNPEPEIGWFPVRSVVEVEEEGGLFPFPESIEVFHWHGETFDLPEGAVRLAESDGCRNQAFQLGRKVIGLQFHLEMTPDAVRTMVEHGRGELVPSSYVQSEEQILSALPSHYESTNRLMSDLLAYLLE